MSVGSFLLIPYTAVFNLRTFISGIITISSSSISLKIKPLVWFACPLQTLEIAEARLISFKTSSAASCLLLKIVKILN